MLRQIVVPTENEFTLHLPDEFVGKKVEVIAFEIEENTLNISPDRIKKEKAARKLFNSIQIDMSGFNFDRDEANER